MCLNETLKQFMNLFWLRPENAVYLTLRSKVIEPFKLKSPAADLSCGDGIFPFVHLGGRIEQSFDVFESVDNLDQVNKGADIFDSYTSAYQPPILTTPNFFYDVGADLKDTSLLRAASLGLYKRLIQFDASESLDLKSSHFETLTNFASINHYPAIDVFLSECYRILKPGGSFFIDILGPNLVTFYAELEKQYPSAWVEMIERQMRSVWPTMHTWEEWCNIFEQVGFHIEALKPVATSTFARIWNVGFRPLSPELIRLRNLAKRLAPNELLDIKRDWVDSLCDLAQPFLENSSDVDNAAGFVFVLRRP